MFGGSFGPCLSPQETPTGPCLSLQETPTGPCLSLRETPAGRCQLTDVFGAKLWTAKEVALRSADEQ